MSPRTIIRADLHADNYEEGDPLALIGEPLMRGDLLIIAGDLCNNLRKKAHRFLPPFVRAAGEGNVIVIPGNHDFYGDCLDKQDKIAAEVEKHGAVWGQMAEVFRGGERYLCCALWTDLTLTGPDSRANGAVVRSVMNDYRYIRIESGSYRKAGPLDTLTEHRRHRAWLEERLAAPFDGRTVVVTHHAPLREAAGEAPGPDSRGRPVPDARDAYASDLADLIERFQPDEWHFGHTHEPFEARIGRTVVSNVSVGYPAQVERIRAARESMRLDGTPGLT